MFNVVYGEYQPWAPLVMDGWVSEMTRKRPGGLVFQDPALKVILSRYPNPESLYRSLLVFWSAEPGKK